MWATRPDNNSTKLSEPNASIAALCEVQAAYAETPHSTNIHATAIACSHSTDRDSSGLRNDTPVSSQGGPIWTISGTTCLDDSSSESLGSVSRAVWPTSHWTTTMVRAPLHSKPLAARESGLNHCYHANALIEGVWTRVTRFSSSTTTPKKSICRPRSGFDECIGIYFMLC